MLLILSTVTFTCVYILCPVDKDSFKEYLVLVLMSPALGFPVWKSAANFKYIIIITYTHMTHSVSFIEYILHLCTGNRLASTKGLTLKLNGFGMASPQAVRCGHSFLLSDRATKRLGHAYCRVLLYGTCKSGNQCSYLRSAQLNVSSLSCSTSSALETTPFTDAKPQVFYCLHSMKLLSHLSCDPHFKGHGKSIQEISFVPLIYKYVID